MLKSALKVVESPSHYVREEQVWSPEASQNAHSLHYAVPYADSFPAELPATFISKYTKRGSVVLDPFCGCGTTAIEAALQGRIPFASDANPLAVKIARAKLSPADITEVTLWLQMVNLARPVALDQYRKAFSSFFELETFREILNLRALLSSRDDRVSAFVELITLGILHGNSAGHLSAYSMSQVALSPTEQERLNVRRMQGPEYRALAPRILRKAAMLGRDGVPSILAQMAKQGAVHLRDARDLSYLQGGSVDLVVSAPPFPGSADQVSSNWLRLWLSGVEVEQVRRRVLEPTSVDEWLLFMNEVLLELARVVKGGGRAVLDLREIKSGNTSSILLDEELRCMVERDLGRFWEPEFTLVHRQPVAKLKNGLKERDESRVLNSSRILVLRRR